MSDTEMAPAVPPAHPPLVERVEAAVEAAIEEAGSEAGGLAGRVGKAIEEWLGAHIRNSPIAEATAAYNHLVAVLPHLAAAILKEI